MRGMHTIPPANIAKIIRQIDKDESHDISQEEFVMAFQQLATKCARDCVVLDWLTG